MTCWHCSPRHHLYSYCFLVFSSKLIQRQAFPLLVLLFRLAMFTGFFYVSKQPSAMSRPRACHPSVAQILRFPVLPPECVCTFAPWQPLPRQPGVPDRMIREADVGSTCSLRDAPSSRSDGGCSRPHLASEDSSATPPPTTEDWNHHFQMILMY